MPRSRTRILPFLLLVLCLFGCARGSEQLLDVTVDVAVQPSPPQVGPAVVEVSLHDSRGEPISGATVELEASMNHAGMVPSLANATEVAPGRYGASLDLTMAGDWFVLVRADLPDGRTLEHRTDLPGVVDAGGTMSMPQEVD